MASYNSRSGGSAAMAGSARVISRRLDALHDAITRRSWADVEWHYDHVRSAVDKHLGVRGRPYDTPAGVDPDQALIPVSNPATGTTSHLEAGAIRALVGYVEQRDGDDTDDTDDTEGGVR